MNILFVCSLARMRSKTAAHCLSNSQDEMRYVGTDKDADVPATVEDIMWADKIICMENKHKSKLRRMISCQSHKMVVWKIPDEYDYMDDMLIHKLKSKWEDL